MRPEPTVHLVADPEEWADLARRVAGLDDRAAGRMVLHPTPETTSAVDFAADVLTSLGKRFDALRFERATRRAWELVEIWFQAEQVRDLFVLRAAYVDPICLGRLTDLALRHGADVWHIGATACARWPHVWSNPLKFLARWNAELAETPTLDDDEFPEVPDDDFLTFRSSCRRLLDAASFERVDRTFCDSLNATYEWLHPMSGVDRIEVLDPDQVAVQLQALLVSASSPAEALTRLRGAQAAYFRAHWAIEFPACQAGKSGGTVPLGPSLDPTMARRLRRLCIPSSTAAMALAVATDLRSEGLSRLNVGDIDQDGGGVALGTGGHRLTVPHYARSLLRALVIERRLAGAVDDCALFIEPKGGDRITSDRLRTILRRLRWATGVAVCLPRYEVVTRTPADWLSERRLRVWPLDARVLIDE